MNGTPEWVKSAELLPMSEDVELGTLRQEKENLAGFTCSKCPNPRRAIERCICEPSEALKGYPWGYDTGKTSFDCRRFTNYNSSIGCGVPMSYTKRCKTCNTQMKKWVRTRRLEERILVPSEFWKQSFVAFVTMTTMNIQDKPSRGDLQEEVRTFKKKVAGFRRKKEFKKRILGGIDVFENTVRPNGDWNIHHHGIWIMQGYWNQREFQEEWGHRVRIEKVRKSHAVLKYLTNYATKDSIEGVRCLETFGASRGAAFAAVEESAALLKDSQDVELASDEAALSRDF